MNRGEKGDQRRGKGCVTRRVTTEGGDQKAEGDQRGGDQGLTKG